MRRPTWHVIVWILLAVCLPAARGNGQDQAAPDTAVHAYYAASEFRRINMGWRFELSGIDPGPGSWAHLDLVIQSGHLTVTHQVTLREERQLVYGGWIRDTYRETLMVEADCGSWLVDLGTFDGTVTVEGSRVTEKAEPSNPPYLSQLDRTTTTWAATASTAQNGQVGFSTRSGLYGTDLELIVGFAKTAPQAHTIHEVWFARSDPPEYHREESDETVNRSLRVILPNSSLEAVDPLTCEATTKLVTPNGFDSSDTATLATGARPASGAVADGATRLLVRARTPEPAGVTFSLVGPGELSPLTGGDRSTSLTIRTLPAAGAHYAFCLYWAPDGLPAGTSRSVPFEISVTIQGDVNAAQPAPVSLTLYQPPVVLLHGLWSDRTAWANFPLLTNSKFHFLYPYEYPNAARLRGNAWTVHQATQDACSFLRDRGIAACRADVIGHSMGGLVGRYWARASNRSYCDQNNYFQGDIRRLITMNTPHYGTRLADWLYNTSHEPIRGPILVRAARMLGCPVDEGAIDDLRLGSQALQAMGASAALGHALVGTVDQSFGSHWEALEYLKEEQNNLWSDLIGFAGDLLGLHYDTSTFFGFGGSCHDIIVGCDSQTGGMPVSATTTGHGQEFWHCDAPKSGTYASACDSLLTDSTQTGAFSTFPAIATGLASPGAWAAYRTASPTDAPQEPTPATLVITSPVEGALVAPGTPVLVTIETPSGSALEASAVVAPLSYGEAAVGDPAHASLAVPLEAVGDYPIMAIGLLNDGQYAYSPVVRLRVDLTGREATRLRLTQPELNLEPRERCNTSCVVECLDGIARPLPPDSSGITYILVDETVATVNAEGVITALTPGTCTILARYDGLLASLAVTVRPPTTDFQDVPVGSWAFYAIRALLRSDIVAGYSVDPPLYCPDLPVSRDQMAVYIARALAGGDDSVPAGPSPATFPDVPAEYWAYKYVEYAKAQSIVTGYTDGSYQPGLTLDRGQMAAFIARAVATPTDRPDLSSYSPPETATFPDVPTSFWSFKFIEYVADPARAVTQGYPDGLYHPEYVCTRDQMAAYVARAFKLPM